MTSPLSPSNNLNSIPSAGGGGMSSPNSRQNSNDSNSSNSNNKVDLDHGVVKYIKHQATPTVDKSTNSTVFPTRPGTAPFSSVTFCAKISGIEVLQNNNNNRNNNEDSMTTRYIPLVDSFDTNKPIDALLGVTRIFKGLEIALRSMAVGERADFTVPPELAHFYGGGQLPRGCFLEMDLLLVSCDNATTIPKLPMIDFEPYKIVQNSGTSSPTAKAQPPKKVYLGSTVDFLIQELDERTGLMGSPTKLQLVAGEASTNPLVDMMLMSMSEREISTFILKRNNNSNSSSSSNFGSNSRIPPQQFYITVIKVTPSTVLPIQISPSMIMKVYDPQQQQLQLQQQQEQLLQEESSNNVTTTTGEQQQQAPLSKSFSDSLVATASLTNSVVDLAPFSPQIVESTLQLLQDSARQKFEKDLVVPAAWYFAAASSVMRQKAANGGVSMAEVNKVLARLARNMGRCAFKSKRFPESLHLARESYSFDSTDAKGAFLLAQALRANELLNEAKNILLECEKMPDCHSESFEVEKEVLANKIAEKTSSSAPPSPGK